MIRRRPMGSQFPRGGGNFWPIGAGVESREAGDHRGPVRPRKLGLAPGGRLEPQQTELWATTPPLPVPSY